MREIVYDGERDQIWRVVLVRGACTKVAGIHQIVFCAYMHDRTSVCDLQSATRMTWAHVANAFH